MAKIIENGMDNYKSILEVIKQIDDAVTITLGPLGRYALLDQSYGAPRATKDGVSVAKHIEFKDSKKNLIASFFKTTAVHTVDQVGDGTTTSILLASNILREALKGAFFNANPVYIKNGINRAAEIAVNVIDSLKQEISNDNSKIEQVAVVAANGDKEIGKKITEAYNTTGSSGVITVEEGKGRSLEVKHTAGMQFDRGYLSPGFATNQEKMIAELDNPYILIYEKKITSVHPLIPLLKKIHEKGKSLLIIADDINEETLSSLVMNKIGGVLKVVAVKSPGFGEKKKQICEDIAVETGGQFITEEFGYTLDNLKEEYLGSAKKITVSANDTIIIEGNFSAEKKEERIKQLKTQIDDCLVDYEKSKLQERLAKLTGGIVVLSVGGITEESAKECKDRVEDAVQAVKAAIAEGIVPGGGVSLLHAAKEIEANYSLFDGDELIGAKAVVLALKAPLKKMLENAGRDDYQVVLNQIFNEHSKKNIYYGLDVNTSKFCNMIESGIVDPVKVVKCALINSAHTASMIIMTGSIVFSEPDQKNENNNPMMG